MAPEIHIPEVPLPSQAVLAAREGRNKRCAGAQGMATRGDIGPWYGSSYPSPGGWVQKNVPGKPLFRNIPVTP